MSSTFINHEYMLYDILRWTDYYIVNLLYIYIYKLYVESWQKFRDVTSNNGEPLAGSRPDHLSLPLTQHLQKTPSVDTSQASTINPTDDSRHHNHHHTVHSSDIIHHTSIFVSHVLRSGRNHTIAIQQRFHEVQIVKPGRATKLTQFEVWLLTAKHDG